jgi:hypothetical protein
MSRHLIEFVDQSTMPQGLWADNLPGDKVYRHVHMEVVPRKDDCIIFQDGERHTVWGIHFYVDSTDVYRIISVGYRYKP